MTAMEIKSNLHQMIDKISDVTVLEAMLELIELNTVDGNQSHWDTLSDEDKSAIQEGIDQLERGEYVSDEEVRKNLKGKFKFL